jgi:hypothetical protein
LQWQGSIRVGSPGGAFTGVDSSSGPGDTNWYLTPYDPLKSQPKFGLPTTMAPTTWANGKVVWIEAAQTMEVPLPPGASGEVVVGLISATEGCNLFAVHESGLLVDDLRLE